MKKFITTFIASISALLLLAPIALAQACPALTSLFGIRPK